MKYAFHEIGVGLDRMRKQNVIVELLFEERVCIKSEDFCGWDTHKKCRGRGGEEGGREKGKEKTNRREKVGGKDQEEMRIFTRSRSLEMTD